MVIWLRPGLGDGARTRAREMARTGDTARTRAREIRLRDG